MDPVSKRPLWMMVLSAGILFLLSGCTSTSNSASGAWQSPKTHTEPFDSFLIVAAVPRDDARRAFEMTLANEISAAGGSKARTTYGSILTRDLSRDALVTLAARTSSQAVIVTRVLDQSLKDGKTADQVVTHYGPAVSVSHDEERDLTVVMSSNYWTEVQEGSAIIKADSLLEMSVYEPAAGDRLVYRAIMDAKFDVGPNQPVEMGAAVFADQMVRRLRKDRVIR